MANESDSLSDGSLRLTRCRDGSEFKARAGDYLAGREAHNMLPLGILGQLLADPTARIGLQEPYLAYVESEGGIVAAAIMTRPYHLVLSYVEQPGALALLARDVFEFEPRTRSIMGLVPYSQQFAEHWQAITGRLPGAGMAECLYQLSQVTPPPAVAGRIRRATRDDFELLMEWLVAFNEEALGGPPDDPVAITEMYLTMSTRALYLWIDGEPVSLAGYAGPTPNGVRIGPVYTPPALRGRGYASALVASLSQTLLDEGRKFCFLFTDAANPTANHIYQAIGYEFVADVLVVNVPAE